MDFSGKHLALNGSVLVNLDISTEMLAIKGIDVLDRLMLGQQVGIRISWPAMSQAELRKI
jgi:capsid portal protein